jgi:hypothetical protein
MFAGIGASRVRGIYHNILLIWIKVLLWLEYDYDYDYYNNE